MLLNAFAWLSLGRGRLCEFCAGLNNSIHFGIVAEKLIIMVVLALGLISFFLPAVTLLSEALIYRLVLVLRLQKIVDNILTKLLSRIALVPFKVQF